VSERDGLRLYFKDLRHDQYIDLDLAVDVHLLTSEIIRRSRTRCTVDQLKRLISVETGANHDLYQVANGHDVAAVLGIALRKLLGCRRAVHTWASEILSFLNACEFGRQITSHTGFFGNSQHEQDQALIGANCRGGLLSIQR
jgi:hypothetical protein